MKLEPLTMEGLKEFWNKMKTYIDSILNKDNTFTGENTFDGAVTKVNGRLGVGTEVYGPNRLGDNPFQTPAVDTKSVNIKDNAQNTLSSFFSTADEDYVVSSFKSFSANDHVFKVTPKNRDLKTQDGASALAILNDGATEADTEGLDLFAQRYLNSDTDVAQMAGIVMLAEGTGEKLDFGFFYKDKGEQTYKRVYKIDKDTYEITFDKNVISDELPTEDNHLANKKYVDSIANSGGDNNFTYSTEEQVTSKKWIDGREIYTKTIEIGTLPNNTSKNVAHNISNVDFIMLKQRFC